jgi:hypothetical protein
MDVRPVDPRDTDSEVSFPVYRVYFWDQPPAPPDVPPEMVGYRSDEYELGGVRDVHEVLQWAEENAKGRTFTLHIVYDQTLIRLAGADPTQSDAQL